MDFKFFNGALVISLGTLLAGEPGSGKLVDVTAVDCNLDGGSSGFIESQLSGTLTESGTTDAEVVLIGRLSADTVMTDRWPTATR